MSEEVRFIPKNTVITAPAGSGKTQKLSEIFLQLLREDSLKMNLHEIVAITFTNKAAGELRNRIIERLKKESPELLKDKYFGSTSTFRISTIHSFFRTLVEVVDPYSPLRNAEFGSESIPLWLKAEIRRATAKKISHSRFIKYLKKDRTVAFIEEMFAAMPVSYVWAKAIVKNHEEYEDDPVIQWLSEVSSLFLELHKKYQEWKLKNNALEFSDIELYIFNMLDETADSEPVGRILLSFNEQIRALLIDEFQDTSKIQWRIIESLASEWLSGQGLREVNQGSIYLIGDPKQSIYLFRGTDVSIMLQLTEKFRNLSKNNDGDQVFRVESLIDNYRSLPAIVDFVNRTFAQMFLSEPHPHKYHITVYEDFRAAREDPLNFGKVVSVIGEAQSTEEASELEAEFIANEIKRLIKEGYMIYDRDTQSARKIEYRDIAVLLKTKTGVEIFERELLREGIPFISLDSGYTSLKPLNFLSSFFMLFNPLYLQDNLLPKIFSLLNMKEYIGNLRSIDDVRTKAPAPLVLLAQAYDEFLKKYCTEGIFGAFLSVREILSDLMLKSGFDEKQVDYSLRIFSEVIYYMEANGMRNLKSISEVVKYKMPEIIPELSTFPDAVTIMSIHKSKGLEFPVVFAGNLYRKGRNSSFQFLPSAAEEDFEKQLDSVYFSVNANHFTKTANKDDPNFKMFKKALEERSKYLRDIKDEFESEDEKRLLYVALTRARDMLYIMLSMAKSSSSRLPKVTRQFEEIVLEDPYIEKIDLSEGVEKEKETEPTVFEALLSAAAHTRRKKQEKSYDLNNLLSMLDYKNESSQKLKKGKPAAEEIDPKRKYHEKVAAGSLIHQTIAEYASGLRDRDSSFEVLRKKSERLFEDEKLKELLILAFEDAAAHVEEQLKLFDKGFFELRFILVEEDEFREGRMDAVFAGTEKVSVCDFKFEVESEEARERYRNQIDFYRRAASEIFDLDSEASLKFLIREE